MKIGCYRNDVCSYKDHLKNPEMSQNNTMFSFPLKAENPSLNKNKPLSKPKTVTCIKT